ncbi:MAG: flagellar assembly protein FliW [Desulfobacula sp.]|nr:flagellar assembly protein FliW [Desulfobacula sp.]
MKIITRKFGEIEIEENKILAMPEGLPGFDGFEKFVLLEEPKTAPFCWFQSIEEPNLSMVVMNPFLFKPDYKLDLDGFICSRDWEDISSDELLIYVVVNMSEDKIKTKITANLMGPLIINPKNNQVVQAVISDTNYSHQHNVLESS